MLISRKNTFLVVTLLALGMTTACTTKRTGGDQVEVTGPGGSAGTAGTGGAIGADASAASVGGGLDSSSLGGDAAAGGAAAAGNGSPLSVRVVHFDYDSADLQQDSLAVLQAHAKYLSGHAAARLAIGGHTDERGTREYNMALGERRAKTVAAFLASNGAKSEQLEVISYGEEKPLSLEDSEAAWAENRRAELVYTAGQPK